MLPIPRLLAAAGALAALTASVLSYGTGVFPGKIGTAGTVPADVTRRVPSCGTTGCHRAFPGGNSLLVSLLPSQRSLDLGQQISVTTSATGGQSHPQDWGGFITEATAGTLSAGSNSQIDPAGKYATHLLAQLSNGRVWTYGYTAPTVPGRVELWGVVNTVDGDGRASASDFWGFQGAISFATENAPVRLFVNTAGVTQQGAGCAGDFMNWPVLGSAQPPAAGNAGFTVELHGASPSSPVSLLVGLPQPPVPLDPIGVQGCALHVLPLADVPATTSAGNAQRGEGTATFSLPIPAGTPPGLILAAQAAVLHTVAGRTLPVTLTNGVRITVQ